MVLFNYATKELTAKVVYYGPGLCGKTTNLQWIHEKLPVKNKGKMLSLATETDRTLFFDFLPIEIGAVRGMRTRIQLYTVPGQVFYNATRRMVLKGADAVVFVCDSQQPMLEPNLESFENMRQNLEANEIDPDEIPIVLQYNKRDLPNALPIEILNEQLNLRGAPYHEAIATRGVGVEDTLKTITKLVFKYLSSRYGEGGAAITTPPDRASAAPVPPARRAVTPQPQPRPQSLPPVDPSAEELLGELTPSAPLTPPPMFGSLPPIELDPAPEPPSLAPAAAATATRATASRPPLAPTPAPSSPRAALGGNIPTRPPLAIEPPPGPSPGARRPRDTLVAQSDEAAELRRKILAPGIPQDAEPELESFEDFEELEPEDSVPGLPSRSARAETTPPPHAPALEEVSVAVPYEAGASEASEVEVPIEVQVAPGTTRLSLKLKLVLTFTPR